VKFLVVDDVDEIWEESMYFDSCINMDVCISVQGCCGLASVLGMLLRVMYCFGLSSKCKIGRLGRIVVGCKLPILSFIVWTLFVWGKIF
jgi:hypothetical protein